MASYTCITCRVAFANPDIQRAHYKTDWHRYNLKRKVADMPPVTAENFQERVLAQRAVVEEQGKETATYCTACSKRFLTFNAYENHLKSKKHLDLEKKATEEITRKVEMLNEKNLEKGIRAENVDKDAVNVAIQQAVKAQPSFSPKKKASIAEARDPGKQEQQARLRPDKPPRLQWYEQQAKKLAALEDAPDSVEEEEDWEDMDSDEEEGESDEEMEDVNEADDASSAPAVEGTTPPIGAIPFTDCLFCLHHSRTLVKNVAHMTKVHSFFIPDIEYLMDLKGLIRYLGEKVGVGKICLWCNERGRSFYTTESVQAHMNDKSHCKLFTDGDAALEFADFYDFRSSYPDQQEGEDLEMPDREPPHEKDLEYDEETMELVLPSDCCDPFIEYDVGLVLQDAEDAKGCDAIFALWPDHLACWSSGTSHPRISQAKKKGARIGHRSLMKYYKQKFGLSRAVVVSKNQRAVGRVLQQYKALGWTGGTGGSLQQGRDMQYVQKMKSKWMLKTGMSNNATKQMHFRLQVRF